LNSNDYSNVWWALPINCAKSASSNTHTYMQCYDSHTRCYYGSCSFTQYTQPKCIPRVDRDLKSSKYSQRRNLRNVRLPRLCAHDTVHYTFMCWILPEQVKWKIATIGCGTGLGRGRSVRESVYCEHIYGEKIRLVVIIIKTIQIIRKSTEKISIWFKLTVNFKIFFLFVST
jgi:hypothetical protein